VTIRTLRLLHRWIGLVIALPMVVQGVTGTILALEPWLPDAAADVTPGTPQPASAIVATARAAVGPDARVLRYVPSAGPDQAAHVQVVQGKQAGGDASPQVLLIDPVDLDVLGIQSEGMIAWVRSLHVQLLAPNYGGRSIGGWFGIGLVLLLVTGVPIWWPGPGGWRAAVTIAWRARGVRFHRRLHGAIGIWTVAVLLVVSVTGVVMAFPRTSRGLLGLEGGGPPRAMRGPSSSAANAVEPDLDRAIALAQQAVPDARLRVVMMPSAPGEAIRLFLMHAGAEGATGSVSVQVDPAGKRVLSMQDAYTQPVADRTYRWMHDLHTATALGPPWRLVSVLSGLSLPVFAVTGPAMWWLRRRNRRRLDSARQAALQPGD
jgi:uncharacterized iron-regulated membrane protein